MDASTLLIEQYFASITNIAFMAESGIWSEDKLRLVLVQAVGHLCLSTGASQSAAKRWLETAIEQELLHLHPQHRQCAEMFRCALRDLIALPAPP